MSQLVQIGLHGCSTGAGPHPRAPARVSTCAGSAGLQGWPARGSTGSRSASPQPGRPVLVSMGAGCAAQQGRPARVSMGEARGG
eukprot:1633023-Pleurochrysis_carterae.AAC.1